MLLLPARGRQPLSLRVGAGQWRRPSARARHRYGFASGTARRREKAAEQNSGLAGPIARWRDGAARERKLPDRARPCTVMVAGWVPQGRGGAEWCDAVDA